MRKYQQGLYDEAKKQGLTAEQIRGMGYQQIADLAGADTKGCNPDFFYENVRRYVANVLEAEEKAADLAEKRAAFETAIRTVQGCSKVKVEITDAGELKIDMSSLSAEVRQ